MQVQVSELAKKGGRIKLSDCGGRLCIVASKNQSATVSDWHGPWNNDKTGQTFVIPNGYEADITGEHRTQDKQQGSDQRC